MFISVAQSIKPGDNFVAHCSLYGEHMTLQLQFSSCQAAQMSVPLPKLTNCHRPLHINSCTAGLC